MPTVSVNAPKTPITKGSMGLATATLPNICKMPGPPAPFVPTPLPNIGKSGDRPLGYSTTVTVEGQPVAIKGASFGSMGDVASMPTGGGIVSNNTQGPTTFIGPGSMDTKIQGRNVQLLGDPMMNNNGPAGSPANAATTPGEIQTPGTPAATDKEKEKCKCCGGPIHSEAQKRPPMTPAQYYSPSYAKMPNKRERPAIASSPQVLSDAMKAGCGSLLHADENDPCAAHYPTTAEENADARAEFDMMMSSLTPPEEFANRYGETLGKAIQARGQRLRAANASSIAHRTPLSGGGCPVGENNLQPVKPPCDTHEKELAKVQGPLAEYHRRGNNL